MVENRTAKRPSKRTGGLTVPKNTAPLIHITSTRTKVCYTPYEVELIPREHALKCVSTLCMEVKRIANTDIRELCCCETFKSFLNRFRRMITNQWVSRNIKTLRTYENDPEQPMIWWKNALNSSKPSRFNSFWDALRQFIPRRIEKQRSNSQNGRKLYQNGCQRLKMAYSGSMRLFLNPRNVAARHGLYRS